MKLLSRILAVYLITTLLLNIACTAKSATVTVTTTTTTGPSGTTRTTTVSGTVVFEFEEELTSSLVNNDFFVVNDIANNYQAGTPTLNVTKITSNNTVTSSSFAMEPDSAAQGSISPVDSSTTPFAYKLTDKSAFDSFISADLNPSGEEVSFEFELSFEAAVQGTCTRGRSDNNYVRIGSGSNLLMAVSYTNTMKLTPPLQPCDFFSSNATIATTGAINAFIASL